MQDEEISLDQFLDAETIEASPTQSVPHIKTESVEVSIEDFDSSDNSELQTAPLDPNATEDVSDLFSDINPSSSDEKPSENGAPQETPASTDTKTADSENCYVRSKVKSLIAKLLALILPVILLFAASVFVAFNVLTKATLRSDKLKSQYKTSEIFLNLIQDQKDSLLSQSKWTAQYLEDKSENEIFALLNGSQTTGNKDLDSALKDMLYVTSGNRTISGSNVQWTIQDDFIRENSDGQSHAELLSDSSQIFIIASVPVKDHLTDRLKGIIFCLKNLSTQEFITDLKKYMDCEISLITADGYSRVITTFPHLEGTVLDNQEAIKTITSGQSYRNVSKIGNQKYLSSYFPIYDSKNQLKAIGFIGVNNKEISKEANHLMLRIIPATAIIGIIIVAVIIMFLRSQIAKPVRNVHEAIINLNSGEADLTFRIPHSGNDELSSIALNVNSFIETLQSIIRQIADAQKSLSLIGSNLESNAQTSTEATTEILSSIDTVYSNSEQQVKSVKGTSEILSKSQENVEVLSDLIDEQSTGISHSSASIEQMIGTINQVTNTANKMAISFDELGKTVSNGNTKLSEMVNRINMISSQSKLLMKANTIISQISAQTNLLAMNAAIEAAHAGSAGQGFAVVAEEIRGLAESSGSQSKEIYAQLKGITESISQVVLSSHDAKDAFEQIVEAISSTNTLISEIDGAMKEQASGSKAILESLKVMKEQAAKVHEKSDTLKEGITMVSQDMGHVTEISTMVMDSMDSMAAGARMIDGAAHDVQTLAQDTNNDIGTLKDLLKKFKI